MRVQGQRDMMKTRGVTRRQVLQSKSAVIMPETPMNIYFSCRDIRSRQKIEKDGEIVADGEWTLRCATGEVPTLESTRSTAGGGTITTGKCVQAERKRKAVVPPDKITCLDALAAEHFGEIDAWLERQGGVNGAESPSDIGWSDPFVVELSISEIGSSRLVKAQHSRRLVFDAAVFGKVYRTCTKYAPGHGNMLLNVAVVTRSSIASSVSPDN